MKAKPIVASKFMNATHWSELRNVINTHFGKTGVNLFPQPYSVSHDFLNESFLMQMVTASELKQSVPALSHLGFTYMQVVLSGTLHIFGVKAELVAGETLQEKLAYCQQLEIPAVAKLLRDNSPHGNSFCMAAPAGSLIVLPATFLMWKMAGRCSFLSWPVLGNDQICRREAITSMSLLLQAFPEKLQDGPLPKLLAFVQDQHST